MKIFIRSRYIENLYFYTLIPFEQPCSCLLKRTVSDACYSYHNRKTLTREDKPVMLDQNTSNRIKATLPIFTVHSKQIANSFYENLFTAQPSIKRLFSTEFLHPVIGKPLASTCPFPTKLQDMPAQSKILADSILFFCSHLGDHSALKPLMDRICAKHVSRMVQPAHYEALLPVFGKSVREVLLDKISEEDFAAWMKAVKLVADILLNEEEKLYNTLENQPGAWTGFRSFAASQLRGDDQGFYFGLTPTDERPIVEYVSGQKVCMRIETQGNGCIYSDTTLLAYSLNKTENAISLKILTRQGPVYCNSSPDLNLDLLYIIAIPKTTNRTSRIFGRLESNRLAIECLTRLKEIHISAPFGQGHDVQASRVTNSWDITRRNSSKRQTWDSFADYVDIHKS